MELSSLSTEYVKVPVAATVNGAVIDPTGDPVSMAFMALGLAPSGGDWKTGSWETIGTTRYARCLVGPAGGVITLVKDTTYALWLKVTDSPEAPVRRVGQVVVGP